MVLSFFLCSMLLFLKLYGFFKNCNRYETIPDEVPCEDLVNPCDLKIIVARAWRFFGVY